MSCQLVNAASETGRPQCLVSTTPVAMQTAPARPARTPTASSSAPERSTRSPTPMTPRVPATAVVRRNRSPSTGVASPAAMRGWIEPSVAATPPGKRYAATNSSTKNAPMLSTPRTAAFHHHEPIGRRRVRAARARPAGRARSVAASRGRPGGNISVVTMYVSPHAAGASPVMNGSRRRLDPAGSARVVVGSRSMRVVVMGFLLASMPCQAADRSDTACCAKRSSSV